MSTSRTLARGLTAANGALLGGAVLLLVLGSAGANLSSSSVLDAPAFALAWAWLLAPPVTGVAGIALARLARSGRLLAANAAVLALWAASTAYLIRLTG